MHKKKFLLSCLFSLCASIPSVHQAQEQKSREPKKPWTFLVYMAADNNLCHFVNNNLQQMCAVGSNENMNILVHLNLRRRATTVNVTSTKITKKFYIKRGSLEQVGSDQCLDSGLAETVISAAKWAAEEYPSDHFAIVFWNHGSGPIFKRAALVSALSNIFTFNSTTNMFEIDRSIALAEYIEQLTQDEDRVVCLDETTGHYLDDAKLSKALQEIVHMRGGKKTDLVMFDACLMACIETAHVLAPYAQFMVSSQDVESAWGHNYEKILEPLSISPFSPRELARHIVTAYGQTYEVISRDFTQSAYDLTKYSALKNALNRLSDTLVHGLAFEVRDKPLLKAVCKSRAPMYCTHFVEPSYVDLKHFCSNLLQNMDDKAYSDALNVKTAANDCINAINNLVISNTAGANVSRASGVSIYFPEKSIHSSYLEDKFSYETKWLEFVNAYVNR